MILCDDTWGWLTLTLPPARAPETPSFELGKGGQRTIIAACLKHFNRTWDIVQKRGATRRIGGA